MKKNRHPVSRIDDLFGQLVGTRVFSQLDLATGFHQLRIADDSIDRTAFRTPDGFYEWLVIWTNQRTCLFRRSDESSVQE